MAALESADLCESDKNYQCVNMEGSFDCVCVPGYTSVNGSCERELHYFHLMITSLHKNCVYSGIVNEPPPPLPPVTTPTSGAENSVNYTTPTLTPETVCYMVL